MSQTDLDHELARLFRELRRADDASAPGFRQVMARARPHEVTAWAGRVALVAACAVVLAAALLLLRQPRASLPAAAGQIARWEAPTDVLLRTPGSDLLSRLPVLQPAIPSYTRFDEEGKARDATPRPRKTSTVPNR